MYLLNTARADSRRPFGWLPPRRRPITPQIFHKCNTLGRTRAAPMHHEHNRKHAHPHSPTGQCFRGLKAMNAQQRGAVGTIIYSDPELDGYVRGPVYPDGPWRPSTSVQRGSAVFNSLCAGDPSRSASDKSVEEICGFSLEELVPIIPVMPISYGDAEPFLRALGGAPAPQGFQGGLDFTYTVGPSPSSVAVRLVVENEEHVGPVWNVIGTIPGTLPEKEDQPVVLGNHRDAWVFGAVGEGLGRPGWAVVF